MQQHPCFTRVCILPFPCKSAYFTQQPSWREPPWREPVLHACSYPPFSMVQVAIHASAHLVLLRCRPYLAARHFSAVAYLNTQASLTIVSHCAIHCAARNSSLAVFSCSPACWCSPKLVDVNVSCMSLCGAAVPAVLAEGLQRPLALPVVCLLLWLHTVLVCCCRGVTLRVAPSAFSLAPHRCRCSLQQACCWYTQQTTATCTASRR